MMTDSIPDSVFRVNTGERELYITGLPFLSTPLTSLVGGADPDAKYIVDRINSRSPLQGVAPTRN